MRRRAGCSAADGCAGSSRLRRGLFHAAREIAFRYLDRFEHGFDFRAALFEPRRKQQALAELVSGFIHRKSIGHRCGTFNQNAAGTAAVDGVEVQTILYLGASV